MASSNNDNRLARLLITHDEAESVLRERIGKGNELLARVQSISSASIIGIIQLDAVRRDFDIWSDYNHEFIKRKFSGNSELRNYEGQRSFFTTVPIGGYTPGENARRLQSDIQSKVDKLDRLLEILALIPSSVAASDDENLSSGNTSQGDSVFIVHGHDDGAKQAVARMIDRLGLNPIILDEQPQAGRTIIEKFEEHAGEVGYAIVLLTPDDVGAKVGDEAHMKPRARQNVIFELGFFVGKLGRERVCQLYKQEVEIPSDYYGVGYVELDENDGWQLRVARELRSTGLPVDLNDL